jgi:predicted GH43/DUF377 family glycosyl hydrolase
VSGAVPVRRLPLALTPDPTRVISRPYIPGDHGPVGGHTRVQRIIGQVLALPGEAAAATLAGVRRDYAGRYEDLEAVLQTGFDEVSRRVPTPVGLPVDTQRLIGSYFVHEYSLQAAALTNPSLVLAPDQSGLAEGSVRFVTSLRAVGEGHISSIEFRHGVLDADGEVTIEVPAPPITGWRRTPTFEKRAFAAKLAEIDADDALVDEVIDQLDEHFSMDQLEAALNDLEATGRPPEHIHLVVNTIHWLAASNYELHFPEDSELSARVIFPQGPAESCGMEDARLVRFVRDDGSIVYYATYTAFDGFHVLPQLIETSDFVTFRIATISGAAARNKGIALFPRLVGGQYTALARSDNENNYVMFSDHLRTWDSSERLQVPTYPWELIQIGNSGAPLETDAGWLVITHGVGPVRTYALGAILLDLDDPTKVIGHLDRPLLAAAEDEREGYVPNVVYSCGQLRHGNTLLIAYGASDTGARFATVELDVLIAELLASGALPDLP